MTVLGGSDPLPFDGEEGVEGRQWTEELDLSAMQSIVKRDSRKEVCVCHLPLALSDSMFCALSDC